MKLKTHQWIILGVGVIGTTVGLYGKSMGWDHGDYFPIFYAGISMSWVAFLKEGKSCRCFRRTKATPAK